MNFFEHQATAKRNTFWLMVLFGMGVASIILLIDILVLLGTGAASSNGNLDRLDWGRVIIQNLPLLAGVSAIVGMLIGGASLYRLMELSSGGGASVAQMLGGNLVQPDTRDPLERKILNIVEEMAIASGLPVPQVFLLEEEGINAFAAGWSPSDAVIGVTRGCVEALNRDELQGVIAHEFSHILHGDMRINIRLIGLLFGIFFLSVVGEVLIRSMAYTGSSNKKNDGKGAILLIGLLLFILGWVGYFFGRLIQAAISRQREFLADASAVQFTRNPSGIGNALRKIAGWSNGSILKAPHAAEASHLFFGNGISGLFALFATHPPLEDRIRRIEGAQFAPPEKDLQPSTPEPASSAMAAFAPAGIANLAGTISTRKTIPPAGVDLSRYARDPADASALLLSMLLVADPVKRSSQVDGLVGRLDPVVAKALVQIHPQALALSRQAKIPLLSLAVPALKLLSRQQSADILMLARELIQQDGEIEFFEFCVWRIARMGLEKTVRQKSPGAALGVAAGGLLAAFANLSPDPVSAFQDARTSSGIPKIPPQIEAARVNYLQLDKIMDLLGGSAPAIREMCLAGMLASVKHDGKVSIAEADLLRAACLSLGIPMPPLS